MRFAELDEGIQGNILMGHALVEHFVDGDRQNAHLTTAQLNISQEHKPGRLEPVSYNFCHSCCGSFPAHHFAINSVEDIPEPTPIPEPGPAQFGEGPSVTDTYARQVVAEQEDTALRAQRLNDLHAWLWKQYLSAERSGGMGAGHVARTLFFVETGEDPGEAANEARFEEFWEHQHDMALAALIAEHEQSLAKRD